MPAPDAEIGEWIVEFGVPFLAPAAGFDGDHARSKAAVLRQKGSVQHVHGLDAIDRNGLAEFAGSRIGHIGLIHYQRAAVFARAFDGKLAIRQAHNSRHQRKDVGDRSGPGRQNFDFVETHLRTLRGALFDDAGGGSHVNARPLRLGR